MLQGCEHTETGVFGVGKGDLWYWTKCKLKKGYVYDSINIRVRRRPRNLLVREKNFEGIPGFTYLGALINSSSDIDQSIKERIQAMDWAYCAGFYLFKNQLINKYKC